MVTQRIGIVELPSLATHLESLGYTIVTGGSFAASANSIRDVLQAGETLDLIVFANGPTTPTQNTAQWIQMVSRRVPVTVVELDGASNLDTGGAATVHSPPIAVADIIPGANTQNTLLPSGELAAPAPEVSESFDLPTFGDDPFASPDPAPAAPESLPAPPSADPLGDDPFADASPEVSPPVPPEPLQPPEPTPPAHHEASLADEVFQAPTPPAPTHEPPLAHVTPRPAPNHSPQSDDTDFSDLYDDIAPVPGPAQSAQPARRGGFNGEVVIVTSGKGGVGKSSTAVNMAQYAAEAGPDGYRVVVVDANRGQGDLIKRLRLSRLRIPTVYDAALSKDPSRAINRPDIFAPHRAQWGEISFALAPAPPFDLGDPGVVSARVYADVIDYARTQADLVVVDTQIQEEFADMWDEAFYPLLESGRAWCLMVTDDDTTAISNAVDRLKAFHRRGITRDRIIVGLMNFKQATIEAGLPQRLESMLSGYGLVLPHVANETTIHSDIVMGKLSHQHDNFRPALSEALFRITGGIPEFTPVPVATGEERGGFISKLFGRKGK